MKVNLAQALVEFKKDVVLAEVVQRLNDGDKPVQLIRELQDGMGLIGQKFETGDYFLSELLMSADLFSKAMEILEPKLQETALETIGKIIIGTPKGDIHDIGKNIFCTVAKGNGFEVHDLGVDVPAQRFVAAVEKLNPQILGFSALLTPSFEPMKEVVDLLLERGLRENLKIIVGGGVTTATVKRYIGADGQTTDVMDGIKQCKGFLGR
ncbi:MAG: cobalamin-dependent protein [Desulfobacterales bacterium]|nr:MAG: cobalamin-dependent protein [Desulfobacterales bacterium]